MGAGDARLLQQKLPPKGRFDLVKPLRPKTLDAILLDQHRAPGALELPFPVQPAAFHRYGACRIEPIACPKIAGYGFGYGCFCARHPR